MRLKLSLFIVFGLMMSITALCQSEPEVIAIAATEENSDNPDTTAYQVKINFNSLHDLKKVHIDLGSSEKARDVVSIKGDVYQKDGKSYLMIGNRSFAFNRYSVTVPVKLSKKDAGKWKFFFAAAEDARGKASKQRVFPKNK